MKSKPLVGLDVHKESIAITVAEEGRKGTIKSLGNYKNDSLAIKNLIKKLLQQYDSLYFCYEAGPCGYGIFRLITQMGYDCEVVAPSLIPKKAGDRVKTDRRDAQDLAPEFPDFVTMLEARFQIFPLCAVATE